jgi:hypothetical protein
LARLLRLRGIMTPLSFNAVSLASLASALALAACSARPDAQASPATRDGPRDTSAIPIDSTPTSAAAGKVATRDSGRTADKGDSATRLTLIAGRTKKDSFSLSVTVRRGLRAMESWPKGPDPLPGAILPAKRIVAYYGNPLSTKMGALGQYPVDEMLSRLDKEVVAWNKADPSTPVQPALHLIAVVAQAAPGRDGKYRLRMDSSLIAKVYGWAQQKNAILFLDIQVGKSTLQQEIPRLLPWLSRPDIHLGIDPEFSMHYSREGLAPGKKIGIFDAADINYAVGALSKIAADSNLPPKLLIVHRFTRNMVTNAAQIRLDPRVQVVMHMDGWGGPWLKFDSYRDYIVADPVQFTGFKLFYNNDTKKGDKLLTAAELLNLYPRPLYIQYQ